MENTEINYTTNKTLMDYYNSFVDVHINYLLFLNSFESISNRGFMELAPILESLKKEMHETFSFDLIPETTIDINKLVVARLSRKLEEKGLSEVKEYIGYKLNIEDIINLATTLLLRNSIISIPSINSDNKEAKIITNTVESMQKRIPSTSLNIGDYSFDLIGYFLESLRIKANNDKSLVSYIYNYISDVAFINGMINRNCDQIDLNSECNYLRDDLFNNLYLSNTYHITNLVDGLNEKIKFMDRRKKKELQLANK